MFNRLKKTTRGAEMQCSYLILIKLVSTEGSNARFDATSAQSDEEETNHGQRTESEGQHVNEQRVLQKYVMKSLTVNSEVE